MLKFVKTLAEFRIGVGAIRVAPPQAVETDLDQSLANLETAARTRSSPLPPGS